MPSLIIFDVGHGSCAFLQDGAMRTLIDCKDASLFIEYLRSQNINAINQVIVSHADSDHIGGILAIIQSDYVQVGAVFVNPDAAKDSRLWTELKFALQDAANRKGLQVITGIGDNMPNAIAHESVRIEVVAPGIAWRLTGTGGRLASGGPITANGMSVVLRLHHENHPVILLPGDLDAAALEDAVARNKDLRADILVYPHHRGNVTTAGNTAARQRQNVAFTTDLLNRSTPKMVIFSIGRGVHTTPRPEIIQQIRAQQPACTISCTQLSENCHGAAPAAHPSHLGPLPARGKLADRCCGGSMEIQLAGNLTVAGIQRRQHAAFIATHVSSPMCTA